jgi:hypothetical protein
MKKVILFMLLLNLKIVLAGDNPPTFVVSPTPPNLVTGIVNDVFEQQNFSLWMYSTSGCIQRIHDRHIEYSGIDINIFVFSGGTVCASPPPPPHYSNFFDIEGLDIGNYNLNYYNVPSPDVFPPSPVNYPNYFVANVPFEVLKISTINSSSIYSLSILLLLVVSISLYKLPAYIKK